MNKAAVIRGEAENRIIIQKFKEGALSHDVETCKWPEHPTVMSVPALGERGEREGLQLCRRVAEFHLRSPMNVAGRL